MSEKDVLPTSGVLKKWTNYVSGWQERYFEIKGGVFLYYKSRAEKACGCRGSFALKSASVEPHEYDDCAFQVSLSADSVWYLRADNPHQRALWIKALARDYDSDYSSTSTKSASHSRNPSVSSMQIAVESGRESEVDELDRRVSELRAYRAMCAEQMQAVERVLGGQPRPETLALRATHLAMLHNIDHIVRIVHTNPSISTRSSPDVAQVHAHMQSLLTPPSELPPAVKEEEVEVFEPRSSSPHQSTMSSSSEATIRPAESWTAGASSRLDADEVLSDCGDEWHDADEPASPTSTISVAEEARTSVTPSPLPPAAPFAAPAPVAQPAPAVIKPVNRNLHFGAYDEVTLPSTHNLFKEIDSITDEQLSYALSGVDDGVWSLFAEDGAMKMYKREVEIDGLPVDPLKAVHEVKGVSALEYMHHFFDARYKTTWDHTLEGMDVLEEIGQDTAVLLQRHKTVWPAAPRESLFWSHIRRVDDKKSANAVDLYIVCNKDVVRPDVPLGSRSSVRVGLTVSMICETIVTDASKPIDQLTREDVTCKIIYVSQVHPGGWVPTAALRHVYKKEYPKFLRMFTEFVEKAVKGRPLSI